MPGLVPGIHVFLSCRQDVDGRVKPGHDGWESSPDPVNSGENAPDSDTLGVRTLYR